MIPNGDLLSARCGKGWKSWAPAGISLPPPGDHGPSLEARPPMGPTADFAAFGPHATQFYHMPGIGSNADTDLGPPELVTRTALDPTGDLAPVGRLRRSNAMREM
jgi:hypothetical protein